MKTNIKKEDWLWYISSIISIGLLTYFAHNNIAFEEKYVILILGAISIVLSVFKRKMLILPCSILMFLALMERSIIIAVISILVMIWANGKEDNKEKDNIKESLALPLLILIIIGGGIKNPIIFLIAIAVYIFLYYDSKKYKALPIAVVLNLFINAVSYNLNSFFNIAEIKDIKKFSDYMTFITTNFGNKMTLEGMIFSNLITAQFYVYIGMFVSFLIVPCCIRIYKKILNNKKVKEEKICNIVGISVLSGVILYIAHNLSIIMFTIKCFIDNVGGKKSISEAIDFLITIKQSLILVITKEMLLKFRWYHLIAVVIITGLICYIIEKIIVEKKKIEENIRISKTPMIIYLAVYVIVLILAYMPELFSGIANGIDDSLTNLKNNNSTINIVTEKDSSGSGFQEAPSQTQQIGNARVEGNFLGEGSNVVDERYKAVVDRKMLGNSKPENSVWSEYYSPTYNETFLVQSIKTTGSRTVYKTDGTKYMVAGKQSKDSPLEEVFKTMKMGNDLAEAIEKRYK